MAFENYGTLVVDVSAASGAYPLSDTVVRIFGASEENRDVQYSLITDIDGVTSVIQLPAPPRSLSQSPGAAEPSFALYNIEISARDYYTKRIFNVAVFDSEETVLPVNMIPSAIQNENVTYPRGNLNAFSSENEKLE